MIRQVQKRLEQQKYVVEIDESILNEVLKQGIDKNYGARPLRRAIQTLVEDRISEEILEGNLKINEKWKLSTKT